MSGDGPDMTPQGLSDAIADLVADLPRGKERVSGSWQKVLVLQVLNTLFEGVWAAEPHSSHELRLACMEAGSALSRAIELLLRERPALLQALIAAYDLEDWTPESRTSFSDSALGQVVLVAVDEVRLDLPEWRRQLLREDGPAGPMPPEPVA